MSAEKTRVTVTVSLKFMGRRAAYEADAVVTEYEDGTHHVEWTALRDERGHHWPIDSRGLEGFDLSGHDEVAVAGLHLGELQRANKLAGVST